MALTSSVVIPAYNAAGTVSRAVRSALDQSRAPLEVIVACDGCTDETANAARDTGATVLELPKANGSVARNAAVGASSGDILFFLDADDWWQPEKIESHMAVWSGQSPSFVMDRSTPVLPSGKTAHWRGGLDRTGPVDWQEFLSYRAWASGSSPSVARANFDAIGGFSEQLIKFQDVDFMVRCAYACGPAHTLAESYTCYSVSASPSVSKSTAQIGENLATLFSGWPFTSEDQRASFASHAYLKAAEVTPWPRSVAYFKKAHWPVSRRFFWKCLMQSLSTRGNA